MHTVGSITRCSFGSRRWPFTYHSSLPAVESQVLPRARSNLTCPSFIHPRFHPQLPTQWTVPTTVCCQSSEQTSEPKQRRWTSQCGSVYQLKDKAAFTCMWNECQSHSVIYIFMFLFVWCEIEPNVDKMTLLPFYPAATTAPNTKSCRTLITQWINHQDDWVNISGDDNSDVYLWLCFKSLATTGEVLVTPAEKCIIVFTSRCFWGLVRVAHCAARGNQNS